jgi:hypothetical protein
MKDYLGVIDERNWRVIIRQRDDAIGSERADSLGNSARERKGRPQLIYVECIFS